MVRAKDPHTTPHPVYPGRAVSGRMMPTNREVAPKASGPKPSPKTQSPKNIPAPKVISVILKPKLTQSRATKGKRTK